MTDPNEPKPEGQSQSFEPMPAAPAFSEQELTPTPVARPKSVDNAFMMWMIIAGLGVLSLIVTLTVGSADIRQAAEDTLRAQNRPFSPQDVDNAANAIKIFIVIFSVLFVGLYLLFVYKMREGRNWARITLTVLGGLNVLSILFSLNSGGALSLIFGLVQAALILAAVYFMFRPDANQYFAASRVRR